MKNNNFSRNFVKNFIYSLHNINFNEFSRIVKTLLDIKKKKSRLFILGLGGSAGNASHAVNDFRKLCNINALTPMDNISEFSATVNDEGVSKTFANYLKISNLNKNDCILVFSVGGGDTKRNSSTAIIEAIKFVKFKKAKIISVLGKKNGYAYKNSNLKIVCDINDKKLTTPIAEIFQAFFWHYLVSHPYLQVKKTFW
jgi:D-sedoheptulose 7-phosphate isomerase